MTATIAALRNTMVGVPDWSDIAMRTAIEAHMAERPWTVKDLAAEMNTSIGSTERWLGGDSAQTVFRARLKRYLETLGYPGDEAAIANARRMAAVKNGHASEPVIADLQTEPAVEQAREYERDGAGILWKKTSSIEEVAAEPEAAPEPVESGIAEMAATFFAAEASEISAEEAADIEIDAARHDRLDRDDEETEAERSRIEALAAQYTYDPDAATLPKWRLPAGFTLIKPAGVASRQKPGITIHKRLDGVTLSRSLITAMGTPERVLVAIDDARCQLLIWPDATEHEIGRAHV